MKYIDTSYSIYLFSAVAVREDSHGAPPATVGKLMGFDSLAGDD